MTKYDSLTFDQKKIFNYDQGTVVVKACPGSGKTHSVAARISRMISGKSNSRAGIAALSFTNVACEEINEKLNSKFGISWFNNHPNFLGTIDKFLNQYVFLPFGHLIMKCDNRPELVGLPYSHWTKGKGDKKYSFFKGKLRCVEANPDGYFDCITFNIKGEIIPIVDLREFHSGLSADLNIDKYYKKNGSPNKRVSDVIKSKWENFKLGFANQSDANYISLKVLEAYPLIAENIAKQFEYFIIDEAQDTDEIQMKILEIIHLAGGKNIMLVGDRDQAIYEWNNAKPELFDAKYEEWDKIRLDENRRSSQKICNFITNLSSFSKIHAIDNAISKYDHTPEIHGFNWESKSKGNFVSFENSKYSFDKIITHFVMSCEQHSISINKKNVAVLYRGKNNAKYLDIKVDQFEYEDLPWIAKNYCVKDIVRGLFLYENGMFSEGYRYLEKGYFEIVNKSQNPDFHCTANTIKESIDSIGFQNHRKLVFNFIESLSITKGKTLLKWIDESNHLLAKRGYSFALSITRKNGLFVIDELFGSELSRRSIHPFHFGTIHSVKGRTYEAVLLILGKKPGNKSNYTTMLTTGPKDGEEEELRNIYVAISRPRKILMLAVPDDTIQTWKSKFKVN